MNAISSRYPAAILFLALFLPGCQPIKGGPVFDSVLLNWFSGSKPAAKPVNTAESRKADMGALLHEMFQVVLLREPSGSGEFDSLWNPLVQGASIEGIYNGLVHSSRYAAQERNAGRATALALRVFADEIGPLQNALSQPTDLGVAPPHRAADYESRFANASFFTLKRVLGDEALKVVDAKAANPASLASWYASWAARYAAMQIDFGLPLRNNPDPKFHEHWLKEELKTPDGMNHVVWEVLNRTHRILNYAEEKGMKTAPASQH